MKVYFEKRLSIKTRRPYVCISVDLGWKVAVLTFDTTTVSDVLNVTNADLASIPVDTKIELGDLKPDGVLIAD
jgi:hypothetical protein